MPYLTVGQESIYYTASQGGNETSLILIHGSGGSHLAWPVQARRLEGADVFAPDLPGHGKSGGHGRSSVREYADFLQALVETLGLEQAVLAGHSLGGAVALTAALDRPEWLCGLVLVGTGARLRVSPKILEGLREDFPATARMVNDLAFGPEAPESLKHQSEQAFLAADPEVMHGDFAACDDFDCMAWLGEIEQPTLVLSGSQDRLTPEKYGRYLAERLPNARLTVLEGCGHMMALEKPKELATLVQEFLQGLKQK